MGSDVMMWSGIAIFVGPIIAAIALMVLRYQLEKGTWWSWGLMFLAGFFLYRWLNGPNSPLHTPTPAPSPTLRVRAVGG